MAFVAERVPANIGFEVWAVMGGWGAATHAEAGRVVLAVMGGGGGLTTRHTVANEIGAGHRGIRWRLSMAAKKRPANKSRVLDKGRGFSCYFSGINFRFSRMTRLISELRLPAAACVVCLGGGASLFHRIGAFPQ